MTETTSTLRELSSGKQGIWETLKLMRDITKQGKTTLTVRQLAASLVSHLRPKDYLNEARALHAYVRDRIRYVRDIRGVETLQTPAKTIEFGYGDCDDKSTLVAAMLESIGHRTRFVALGFKGKPFSHVYVETRAGNSWVGIETTEAVPFGWTPPGVTSRMVIYNK